MGLVSSKGTDINFGGDVDLEKVFIRLKENQSVRVRVLSIGDYAEYSAHSEFNLKVYTQPCIKPLGQTCILCHASKSGVVGFDKLYAKKRYLFAFGDLDTGEVRVWDASKNQAKELNDQIKEYADDIGDIAFNFKRTGTKTDTSYKLNPILKFKGNDKELFSAMDELVVPETFYEDCLVPRSEQLMMDILDEAGFPVKAHFPEFVKTADGAPAPVPAEPTLGTEEPESDDLPF